MTSIDDWITLTDAAERVVQGGYADTMSRQRLTELADTDPSWPVPRARWKRAGRAWLVPWPPIEAYFKARDTTPGPKGWGLDRRIADELAHIPPQRGNLAQQVLRSAYNIARRADLAADPDTPPRASLERALRGIAEQFPDAKAQINVDRKFFGADQ